MIKGGQCNWINIKNKFFSGGKQKKAKIKIKKWKKWNKECRKERNRKKTLETWKRKQQKDENGVGVHQHGLSYTRNEWPKRCMKEDFLNRKKNPAKD